MTPPRPKFEKPLEVLEKNRLVAGAAVAALVLGPLMVVASMAGVFPPGIMGIHVFLLGLAAGVASHWKNFRPKRRRADVRADGDGVRVGGTLVVPRARVADGFFQPRSSHDPRKASSLRSSVRLVDRQRRIFESALDELASEAEEPRSRRA